LCVFVLIVASVLACLMVHVKLWQKTAKACEQRQLINSVLINIVREVRTSTALLPTSNQGQLVLQVGTETIEYCLSSNKVKRRKNTSSAYLTEENQIKILAFSYPQNKLIKIVADDFSVEAYVRN